MIIITQVRICIHPLVYSVQTRYESNRTFMKEETRFCLCISEQDSSVLVEPLTSKRDSHLSRVIPLRC